VLRVAGHPRPRPPGPGELPGGRGRRFPRVDLRLGLHRAPAGRVRLRPARAPWADLSEGQAMTDADEPRPWERPGAVRRDCKPHRGELLGRLGDLSLALGVLAMVTWAPALVGLPLALVVVVLAPGDLAQMDAGVMDPAGREQ